MQYSNEVAVAVGITVDDDDGGSESDSLMVVYAFDPTGPWATLSNLTELPASVFEGHRTIGASYVLYLAARDGLDQSAPVWLEHTVKSDDVGPPAPRSPFPSAVPKSPIQSSSPGASLPVRTSVRRARAASPLASTSPRASKSLAETRSDPVSLTASATPPRRYQRDPPTPPQVKPPLRLSPIRALPSRHRRGNPRAVLQPRRGQGPLASPAQFRSGQAKRWRLPRTRLSRCCSPCQRPSQLRETTPSSRHGLTPSESLINRIPVTSMKNCKHKELMALQNTEHLYGALL
jgi:hypothetical protein